MEDRLKMALEHHTKPFTKGKAMTGFACYSEGHYAEQRKAAGCL